MDLIHYRWIGFGMDCSKKGLDWFKKIVLDFWILPTSEHEHCTASCPHPIWDLGSAAPSRRWKVKSWPVCETDWPSKWHSRSVGRSAVGRSVGPSLRLCHSFGPPCRYFPMDRCVFNSRASDRVREFVEGGGQTRRGRSR